jgi:hypothetical protein
MLFVQAAVPGMCKPGSDVLCKCLNTSSNANLESMNTNGQNAVMTARLRANEGVARLLIAHKIEQSQ